MNYWEGDSPTGLFVLKEKKNKKKPNTIEDCQGFLVVNFIIFICYFWYLGLGGGRHEFLFLGNTFRVCQPSPMTNALLKVISSILLLPFTSFRWFFFIIRLIGFIIPKFCKETDFPWNVINTSAREVSNNKVSHLLMFILDFGT